QKKWEIALEQVGRAIASGVRKHVVLGDAGYGDVGSFRDGLDERGLNYVVGISRTTVVYPPNAKFALPKGKGAKQGRPATRLRTKSAPIDVKALALKHEDS
ncbi:MAG: transposase, partial [Myxococcales bacterium]|nr:transposase [Myxococcales bacterium]